MNFKKDVPERILMLQKAVVVISLVKGDSSLFRIIIDSSFKGYLQNIDGVLYRTNGSSIKDNEFKAICDCLESPG